MKVERRGEQLLGSGCHFSPQVLCAEYVGEQSRGS